jgi:hypothetical protein
VLKELLMLGLVGEAQVLEGVVAVPLRVEEAEVVKASHLPVALAVALVLEMVAVGLSAVKKESCE